MEAGKVAFDGTNKGLIGSIKGQVWEFFTENKSAANNENSYFIVHVKAVENGLKLRVVSPVSPHLGAVRVKETLEDAYLNFLSKKAVISGDN